ncbi:hypothetical protein D9M71_99990 [compost metagenome]
MSGTATFPLPGGMAAGGTAGRVAGRAVGSTIGRTVGSLIGRFIGGAAGSFLGPLGTVGGAVAGAIVADALVDYIIGTETADQVATATDKADGVAADATACLTCGKGINIPRALAATLGACAALACTPPYLGGAHACTSQPPRDGFDSHHMPADSATAMPTPMGPAIKITPEDHRRTTSYGGATGPSYAHRRGLVASGRAFAAFLLDVAEIRALFPGKYEVGLSQATAYASCLHAHGLLR